MTFVAVQEGGLIALPADTRARYGLDQPGMQIEVVERDGELLLRPHVAVPADQAWFWAAEWQERERVADVHRRSDEVNTFNDAAAFVKHLEDLRPLQHAH
jgi:antitoxin MazE